MLENIRIVLVETFHPGNIGSTARAMKTMGIENLVLVSPRDFPADEALTMAVGAADVVESARVVDSLEEAVADCRLVVASSARRRGHDWPVLEPEECAGKMIHESESGNVALVFGPERMGLSNAQLQLCNFHVAIPANPEYSSLNLAQAVQTLSYEIYKAHRKSLDAPAGEAAPNPPEYPKAEDMERFYTHLEETLRDTGFLIPQHPGELMVRLRRLFNRARPEVTEMNILRGILSSVQKAVKRRDD